MKKVAVVIPVYKGLELLKISLLKIIASCKNISSDIFVIDNSNDNSVKLFCAKYNQVSYSANKKNVFISKACNKVYKEHKVDENYDYYLIIAQDVLIDKLAVKKMTEQMDSDSELGIVGPIQYEYGTKILRTCGLNINIFTSLLINYLLDAKNKLINHYSSCYMIRSNVYKKLGGFNDDLFPMVFEEPDFGNRVLKLGYAIRTCFSAKIQHPIHFEKVNQKIEIRKERLYSSAFKAYFFSRNRIIYMNLYSKTIFFIIFILFIYPALFIYYLFSTEKKFIKDSLLGFHDGLIYLFNKDMSFIKKQNSLYLGK